MSIIKHHSSYSVSIGGNYYESNSFDRVCQAEEDFKTKANRGFIERLKTDESLQDFISERNESKKEWNGFDDDRIDED
jgi:hypothetical protein